MILKTAYKFRIYPTEEQKASLTNQFGQVRFVYNHFLTVRKEHFFETGKGLNYYYAARMLTELKGDPDFPWLGEGNAQAQQQALRNLDNAYKNFFEMSKTGTLPKGNGKPRKDGMSKGYPKYHGKYDDQSLTIPQNFKANGSRFYLPKVGWIRTIFHRAIEGKTKGFTVSKTKSGRYFVSIKVEKEVPDPGFTGGEIGIDLGLKDFVTFSNDEPALENPRWLRKAEKKLKRLQRKVSRKKKGSKNRNKARLRLAKQHEKVANQRNDFHHKQSKRLVDENRYIALENLNVQGMQQNHHLAKSISDAGWHQFVGFIIYKGQWYGARVEKVNRFFPSSKLCNVCGHKNTSLELSDRHWTCASCGALHDRDHNAAINILNESKRTTAGAAESYALGDMNSVGNSAQEAQRL